MTKTISEALLKEPLLVINQFDDTVSGESLRAWLKWNKTRCIQELIKAKQTGQTQALDWVEKEVIGEDEAEPKKGFLRLKREIRSINCFKYLQREKLKQRRTK